MARIAIMVNTGAQPVRMGCFGRTKIQTGLQSSWIASWSIKLGHETLVGAAGHLGDILGRDVRFVMIIASNPKITISSVPLARVVGYQRPHCINDVSTSKALRSIRSHTDSE